MSTRKPIYVFEGGGSNPHVIATIDTDKFSDHDSKAETAIVSRKVNNISTIEITIPTNCEASKLITNTSDLVLFDSKGNIQEFHITDIDDMDEYSVNRTIYAEQSFGELINNIVTGDTAMPTTTNPSDYLAYILSFTRWSVGTVDTSIYNAKWEEDLTGLTCLEAFQKLVEKYNCEFEIRYTIDGKNKITGRYVDLKKKIGSNYGKRFEDKKDIIGLKRNLDLDSVKTAIYPRIKIDTQDENGNSVVTYIDISSVAWSVAKGDPVDKPLGQTVLVNPEADEIYKRYNTKTGNLMEKIMYAEWTGDTASDAEDLCRQAWSILKANGVLTPTIEVTASDLYRMSGNNSDYYHEQVDLGDTCIIIDKNFEPELRITTRVMEIEEDILNPVNNTYVFGNYRKTLATSNIESQKSIEDQLTQLQDRIQSITIPEYSLPYQSGKDYYADIKEQVQNEFMSSSGYVMAQDADGFWVFDAPVAQTYSLRSRSVTTVHPTKATILKGGCLALAEYNTATSSWEIGTFINGTSVNADYINTGHLSGNVIEANSITADHLKIAAIEYIRNGLATEQDLQNVIDDIQANYATTDAVSTAISNAVAGLDPDVAAANAKVNSINISFDAIDIEYKKNLQQANTLLENSYLTGTTKTNLSNAKADYINKFTAVQTAKNDIVNNVDVSDTKMTAYNNALSAFKTSATTLGKRMEEAATAINSAVASDSKKYADGLKTSLDSEISDVSNSVSNLESTMNNAFKDNVISEAEAIAIQQQLDRLDTEKTDIDNEYSTLMYNSNLTGTAKTTLTSKYNAHATAYTNLVNAITNAIGDNKVDNAERTEIENCKTAYNTALGEYRTSAQSAIDAISSKRVENAMVNVVDSETLSNAINTAVQGLATEDYVNNKASQAKDEATIAAQVKAITDLQKQLQTEYKENNAKANKVYSDKYLPAGSTAKTDLNNKISAYTTAYNNYNNYITTMLSDNTITNQEYSQYSSYADAYSTALKNLAEAMEVANSTRLENVYTQARAGLVTTAELEVNNESVIASAKAGMVSTADMTSAINTATKNLVSNTDLNNAIADFTTTNDVSMVAKIESIKQSYNAITTEYKNNLQQATTLYSNSYLGGTAKTNLNSAKSDYTTKYNAVTSAYNNVVADADLTNAEVTAWNNAIKNLQSATTTLAQRVQEASTYINTAVYNSSKSYTDTAIPDALTGYAKTKYVDDAKAAAIADARNGMVSTSQLEVNNKEILMKTASMGQYNLLRNTDYRAGTEHWNSWGTSTGIKIKIGTSSDYGNCMSGERNLGVTTDNSITSLDHSVGFKQYVELTGNVTYTLSYWVNCVKCRCTINIETNDTIGGESTGILATKNYTNINGNQKRETWKYDSITFTVPKLATNYDKKVVSVVFYIDSVSKAQARAWLVKPMLGTGINAQAWTAHPDEIHVGVVSVTEEEGIKVEHSDSDTYTTLDAAGLKIRSTNDDSLVASFGENNSAYIGKLTCDGYVKAPQLMPVANYKDVVHMYYCSETGSGDFSGKSSNNQASGWGGVMRAILSDLDIDYTHEKGGFIIPTDFTGTITVYIKGTEFSSDIVLGNIFGGGNSAIQIRIDAGCKFTGRIILSDIDIPVQIFGNNSTMYRGSSKVAPISLDNVKYCYVYQLMVNYSSQQIATVAVQMYDSNCNMTKVDMCNCYSAAALNRSHLFMSNCSGNLKNYVNGGQLGYLNMYGKVPAHTDSNPYGSYCINTTPSNRTLTPTGTTQSGGSSVTMNVTKTINITTYSSVLEYYRYGCLIQGTPNDSTKNYVGNMTVSNVNKVLATMNNDAVIQVFLEREGTTTVDTDYVDVVIDGTKVGTLRSTASGWFNLPSSTVNSLKNNETVTIKLNATGRSNYTQYKLNAMLKITGTQTV